MYVLSTFTKPSEKKDVLYNSITERSIGYSPLIKEYLNDIFLVDLSKTGSTSQDKIYQIILAELIFTGIVVPKKLLNSTAEEDYLRSLVPAKLLKEGFFGSEGIDYRTLERDSEGKVISFLGVPCDLGAKRPGTRFGPSLLRANSQNLNFRNNNQHLYSLSNQKNYFKGKTLCDLGDIAPGRKGNIDNWIKMLYKVVAGLPLNTIPVIFGGDHTFTYPIVKGIYKRRNCKPFTVIQLDHHLDIQVWGSFERDEPVSLDAPVHSNFMSWIKHEMPDIQLLQIGIFNYQSIGSVEKQEQEVFNYLKKTSKVITNCDILSNKTEKILSKIVTGQDVYLTIDVDVLNANYLSQTGYPAGSGISLEDFTKIVKHICKFNNIIGLDIMEFGKSYRSEEHAYAATFINTILLDMLHIIVGREEW